MEQTNAFDALPGSFSFPSRLPKLKGMKHFPIVMALFLVSCATYDPDTGNYKDGAPEFKASNADPILGAIGAVGSLIQMADYSPKKPKARGLIGKCREQIRKTQKENGGKAVIKFDERPCQSTYIAITPIPTGKSIHVWIDENGVFEFRGEKGHKYEIQAFNEERHISSSILSVVLPREIQIQIQIQEGIPK